MGKLKRKPRVIKVMFTTEQMINARDNSARFPSHREFVEYLFDMKGYKVTNHPELKYFPLTKAGHAYGFIVEGNPGLSLLSK